MDRRNQWFSCLTNTIIYNNISNRKKNKKYNPSRIIFFIMNLLLLEN